MKRETEQARHVILSLVRGFVERPDALQLEAQEAQGDACYWMMKPSPEDEAKLVGRGGSHVKALKHLVEEIGAGLGQTYTFRLITERSEGPRTELAQRDVIAYQPEAERALLSLILEPLLDGAYAVRVGPGEGPRQSLTFQLTVKTTLMEDYRLLTVPGPKAREGETIVGSLGTLFRAVAKKRGVRFNITIEQP